MVFLCQQVAHGFAFQVMNPLFLQLSKKIEQYYIIVHVC
jgi:hypothetical protein